MRTAFLYLLLFATSALIQGAEISDLGQGLGYLRVHSLEEAVKPLAGSGALVIDLRRTTANPESVDPFSAALAGRAATSRVFVLVSPDTPAVVTVALKSPVIMLGIRGSQPEPQVVVQQSGENDRRAYDALASGTPLPDLISGKTEKERYDEASLVQEFKGGNHDAKPPAPRPSGNGENQPPAANGTMAPARPITDRVHQRAVHLHRALLALKR
jgi:hypothetical protein